MGATADFRGQLTPGAAAASAYLPRMRDPLFLGLDLGTSSLKALLIDGAGRLVATGTAAYPLATPRAGWSEQHPEDWVQATGSAVRAALDAAAGSGHPDPARRVAAIGFSGQMHGAVLVDRGNVPLRPCILWNDARSTQECAELEREIGPETVLSRTGNRLLPGFTAPKVRWVQRHEPDIWKSTDCILLPKDYLRLRLGGVRATDASDASGTLYFDVAQRQWSAAMLRDLGIDPAQVPSCHESPDVVDRLSPHAARRLGLTAGIPLVAGAGDQAAAAIGLGVWEPGAVCATLGTSGVIFAASDSFRASPDGALHAFCHALPGRWHLMSVMLSAGGSLRWFLDTMARDAPQRAAAAGCSVHEWLDREASRIPPGCEGVTFVPTIAGERCPIPDPSATGSFLGLTLATTQAHLARAVLESVAASMALCLDLIREGGVQPSSMLATGGGFESALWSRMHADAFGIPLQRTPQEEGSARGAALLGGLGTEQLPLSGLQSQAAAAEPLIPDPEMALFWDLQRRLAQKLRQPKSRHGFTISAA